MIYFLHRAVYIPGFFQVCEDPVRMPEVRRVLKSKYFPGGDSMTAWFFYNLTRQYKIWSWVVYRMRQQGKEIPNGVQIRLEETINILKHWGYLPYEDLMIWDVRAVPQETPYTFCK